jgi:hypothetical protein
MKMPELQPKTGWKYRIIVCTPDRVMHDDVNNPDLVPEVAKRMISANLAGGKY